MSDADAIAAARAEWTRARAAARAVLREPGALPAREVELLRGAALPQIEAALAGLGDGRTAAQLAAAAAFLPGTVTALGEDAGLAAAAAHLRAGVAALAAPQRA